MATINWERQHSNLGIMNHKLFLMLLPGYYGSLHVTRKHRKILNIAFSGSGDSSSKWSPFSICIPLYAVCSIHKCLVLYPFYVASILFILRDKLIPCLEMTKVGTIFTMKSYFKDDFYWVRWNYNSKLRSVTSRPMGVMFFLCKNIVFNFCKLCPKEKM